MGKKRSKSKAVKKVKRAPSVAPPRARGTDAPQEILNWLCVVGARQNNLKNITVRIPLGRFVCTTGVSGSGKSSLVNEILREALARELNGAENAQPGAFDRIEGLEHLDKVIDIDQTPIGRTPRSNPATYIKVFDQIRDLYARLPDARVRGYKPGRFSFNVPTGTKGGGRCEACEGNGSNRLDMELLADMWVTCPICEGRRFNHETVQILYKGRSIADVLNMDVQEALDHFAAVPKIADMLQTLHDVGLDYLKLGQSSTTLSGGEAQRVKLARELVKRSTGHTLYLLDEPTTGLHFADIRRLLDVLHGFVDAGNTVLVIEHNLDVIKTADWVIDLGPEGGAGGGRIVAEGTPEELAGNKASYTGQALAEVLGGKSRRTARKGHTGQRNKRRTTGEEKAIRVVGARQHNLKNISVEVPRGAMTVCAGPSGSGKSSFAIDTLYTEGQRRYVESLSAYARQFLGRLQPPKVDHVYGLSPAICIEQKNTSRSPRSTVGTVTEIFDYMRVLWARLGRPWCPTCRVPIASHTSEEIVSRILGLGEGTRVLLLAPISPVGGESLAAMLERERANGYARVRLDGEIHELNNLPALSKKQASRVELVVDRITVRKDRAGRLNDSVEQALVVGDGVLLVQVSTDGKVEFSRDAAQTNGSGRSQGLIRFSRHRSCERCGSVFDELTPHHFSFNTRLGWCELCEGLGVQQGASPTAVVTRPSRSLLEGAVGQWGVLPAKTLLRAMVSALARHIGFDAATSWNKLNETHQVAFLQGCGPDWITLAAEDGPWDADALVPGGMRFRWRGFYPAIDRATRVSYRFRQQLEDMVTEVPCEACHGSRLQPVPAAVRLANATLHEVSTMPLNRALAWFNKLSLDSRERKIAGELLHEITSRLSFLVDVGLDYISLHRTAATLSGGEAQRIQLASQIGTGLTGVLYVLDEPTIGLHPRDNGRLIQALTRLRDLGNTLLVVEHDREVIDAADHVLDFGPGAGSFGGEITAAAAPDRLRGLRASLTGRYLSGKESIPVPSNRRAIEGSPPRTDLDGAEVTPVSDQPGLFDDDDAPTTRRPVRRKMGGASRGKKQSRKRPEGQRWLTVVAACENNLKEIDAAFPLGRFTCVTGVSGSGKSTLVNDVLYHALASRLHRARLTPGSHERIMGIEEIDKVINVDQSPIGNSPTSNPATYTGVFDLIRGLFARLPLSRVCGYSPHRFSFNRPGGRCEACEGMGQRCIEMHFLPDVWVTCDSCAGRRFVPETLEVQYHGKSIAEVLEMRISDAVALFESVPQVVRMLRTLEDVGLGYLQLGQPAPTLSGGEAQRVKLAAELGRPSTGKTLYILDEPTTGLHIDDLRKLLDVLHRLVDLGNSVICIEHNLEVIKTADWVIDLGPEAGEKGGAIVYEGTPEQIAGCSASHTGAALRPVLAAGPHRDRPLHTLSSEVKQTVTKKVQGIVSDPAGDGDARLPWEVDGKRWHTVNHLDREGQPVAWEAKALIWIEQAIQTAGGFAPTNWNDRTRIEIKAEGSVPWFGHILTGGKDLFDVALRVPAGTFDEKELIKRLKIRTLDERGDLPIYGQWSRVRVRSQAGGWQEVRLHIRDLKDVQKTAWKAFLKKAAAAYHVRIGQDAAEPEKAAPWRTQGVHWHLSQKSINKRKDIAWQPPMLMALIGVFKRLQGDLTVDWAGQTAAYLRVPGIDRELGKIVTNQARGLRVELRVPTGELTPARIDRLGADAELKTQDHYDRLVFWVTDPTQMDREQLADAWQQCLAAAQGGALQSV